MFALAPRPYNPRVELDGALQRGDLNFAITLANELAEGRPGTLDLSVALRFLPLVSASQPQRYDVWALRWLGRWLAQTSGATIDATAEIACTLADARNEPLALRSIEARLRRSPSWDSAESSGEGGGS